MPEDSRKSKKSKIKIMHNIIPGILEKDFTEIEKKFEIIRPFSRTVHIDILDGKFTDEASFLDPTPFGKYKDDFFMEVHLMVDDPTKYLKPFAKAGFQRFLGHAEKMKDLEEFVAEGEILGEVGIAIDSTTSIDSLTIPYDDLDVILLMGVKAGQSGQSFLPETLEKIKNLKAKTWVPIQIDGGINEKTIIDAKNVGADRFVATSFIFTNPDPMQAFEKLLSIG